MISHDQVLDLFLQQSTDLYTDMGRVYLDHNATTPIAPMVKNKVAEWLESWGNPSSVHWSGRGPKLLIRESRNQIAKMLGASPLELVFTASGSEANNLAIKGTFEYFQQTQNQRNIWVTTKIEHTSNLKAFESILAQKSENTIEIVYIDVDRNGKIDLEQYHKVLEENAEKIALVSIMLANNETGNIFPIKKMVKAAHKVGALFHTDAVQALGKMPVNLEHLGVDMASFSGHKFYSLKGVGVLFLRSGLGSRLKLTPQIVGGGQERKLRAGTENTLAIASFGLMAGYADMVLKQRERLAELRDHLQLRISNEIQGVKINGCELTSSKGDGSQSKRVPNTLSVTFAGIDGESLLMNLDMKGFAISTGSACSSGSPEPSKTLRAMGLTRKEAQSSLRVSLGWGTDKKQIDLFADALVEVVARLRKLTKAASVESNKYTAVECMV